MTRLCLLPISAESASRREESRASVSPQDALPAEGHSSPDYARNANRRATPSVRQASGTAASSLTPSSSTRLPLPDMTNKPTPHATGPDRIATHSRDRALRRDVPPASSESARERMKRTRRRDTKPELALRSELHRLGLRYFVDRAVTTSKRRADVVFPRARVAVYVDGCFWHGCPTHGTLPKTNREWWASKLEANRSRDQRTDRELAEAGWIVLRFWEHDDPVSAARRVKAVLNDRPSRS